MSVRLRTAYFFKISLCLIFGIAGACATATSFSKSAPEIRRIAFIYDQPLRSDDVSQITGLLKNHQYATVISTERFTPGTSVWIYIPENILKKHPGRKILVTGYQDYIDVYAIRSGEWVKIRTGGKYVPASKLDATVGREFVTLYDSVAGISKGGYLIACRKFNNFNYSPLMASLKSREELTSWQLEFRISAEKYPKFIFPFVGVLLTTVLHLLVLFFLSKNWSYTYHAIGLLLTLSLFIFCYFQYPINVNDSPFDDPKTLINFDCFVLFLALACNFMSVRGFYDTGKSVQLNNLITARLAWVAVIVAVVSLIFSILTNLYYLVNYISIALEPVISCIYAVYLFRIRKEIKNAFRIYIFGLCFLTVFLEAAFLLSLFASNNSWGIGSEVLLIFPMILGISIFNGFIITAVITRNYQTRLESASLRARATEAEMAAVQRGMSPHFIFNCLNLIDYFLYKNETTAARNVLFDFSDLLRLVIDKSPKQLIQLSEELKILELYMNLEKSRSDNSFRYSVTISPHLDIELFLVPPLIVQPIVENAIKHGILNRKLAGGQIDISISRKNEELLEIKVEDNGAGRRITKLLQQNSYRQVGHVGISHTEKRLEIISEVFGVESFLKIIDKPNDYEGTIVKMYLPLLQSKANEAVLRKASDLYR